MARKAKNRILRAWMNGTLVGTWKTGMGIEDEFSYDKEWLTRSESRAISLSMPLRKEPYKGHRVQYYFDNLLPDNDQIRRRIQERFGTSTTRPFDLLSEIGRDCVGAIQLLPEDDVPTDVRTIQCTPINDMGIEQLLSGTVTLGRQGDEEDFRISLAGAQEKTALLWHNEQWQKPHGTTPTTHILKLPIGKAEQFGIDLSTSVENEWLCEQLLHAYGIAASKSEIKRFGSKKVLVVERFDRRFSSDRSWILRLPQEDFCQATGTSPGKKYENDGGPGISEVMKILLGSKNAANDRVDFFKTQIIFWMLCAIDGHAKNFSIFLESESSYRLTPRYDVLSAYPIIGQGADKLPAQKIKMAMAFTGKNRHYRWDEILPRHIVETARKCGLKEDGSQLMKAVAEETYKVIDIVVAQLPSDFPEDIAKPIFNGLSQKADQILSALS